jgi:hypothetical protein
MPAKSSAKSCGSILFPKGFVRRAVQRFAFFFEGLYSRVSATGDAAWHVFESKSLCVRLHACLAT